jgi:hypothetical protein
MRIVERGVLNCGEPGGKRAVSTFPSITVLPTGRLLACYRVGSTKDSDDQTIELRQSEDHGRTWTPPATIEAPDWAGQRGSMWVGYASSVTDDQLIIAVLWVDRDAFPGRPLFNDSTEGCLPMRILLADSFDDGATWTAWRELTVPDNLGPPSLTNPIVRLSSGRLVASIETNKHYEDRGPWRQRVVYTYSEDRGASWSPPRTTTEDPTGRFFHWDQRAAATRDGRLVTFTWTYDRAKRTYLNIHRRLSRDEGLSWTPPEALGFSDQPSHPAILPDGRVVLAWVDRFGSRSIRARLAQRPDGPFESDTEVELYQHAARPNVNAYTEATASQTGALLAEMGTWNYGLPYAEAVSDGSVLVTYYEPAQQGTQVAWARLAV